MLKLPTTLVNGGLRSITGYSGFVDAVMSVFIFASFCYQIQIVTAAIADHSLSISFATPDTGHTTATTHYGNSTSNNVRGCVFVWKGLALVGLLVWA